MHITDTFVAFPDLVDAISFTGSVPVGKGIARAAIENLTKVQMEMGSKNALAVMDDADLDLAVSLALGGAFGGSGQKCTASLCLLSMLLCMMLLLKSLWLGQKR